MLPHQVQEEYLTLINYEKHNKSSNNNCHNNTNGIYSIKMTFRYILNGIITLIAFAVGLFITPINYLIKDWLRKFKVTWWFLNDYPPFDENDIDAGDYGRFKHNFIGFYRQNAFRNSHWNLRMLLRPNYQMPYAESGNLEEIDKTWNPKRGVNLGTFRMNGKKYFRLTWIIKILWWYSHGQFGLSKHHYNEDGTLKKAGRYYYKLKAGKFKNL